MMIDNVYQIRYKRKNTDSYSDIYCYSEKDKNEIISMLKEDNVDDSVIITHNVDNLFVEKSMKVFHLDELTTLRAIYESEYGICGFCNAFDHDYGSCTVDEYNCIMNELDY